VFSSGSGQPPAITSQSQNQTVTNGASVTFSVNATGTPPLNFQWQCNGTNLPGAVSSNLTLTGVTFAQAGFYAAWSPTPLGSTISDPVALSVWCASAPAFSYLTYNAHGNGLTNWSTNMWHVQAIGRQMQYLNPDIITFNEIPVTNNCTAQMADFVTAFRPGYYLVTNSMDDGFIRSVILSRFPSSPRPAGCTVPTSRLTATPVRVSPAICSKRKFPFPVFRSRCTCSPCI
jgi:hypothetical protein